MRGNDNIFWSIFTSILVIILLIPLNINLIALVNSSSELSSFDKFLLILYITGNPIGLAIIVFNAFKIFFNKP